MKVGLEVKAEKKVKTFLVSSADCRTISPLKLPAVENITKAIQNAAWQATPDSKTKPIQKNLQ
jgi:hypothetical protein